MEGRDSAPVANILYSFFVYFSSAKAKAKAEDDDLRELEAWAS